MDSGGRDGRGNRDNRDGRVRWADVLLATVAATSWALVAMAGAAALGLHLLDADAAAALGPMTAAVVVLAAGGSVAPSGDLSAFGLNAAAARADLDIMPLGVSLTGAVVLAFFFLRSLRHAGRYISGTELAVRAGAVAALFTGLTGALAWAAHDVVTIDGSELELGRLPGGAGTGIELPGGLGDLSGLLPERIGDLADAGAAVGFRADTVGSLTGALMWVLGVLLISLLASRRTPLPRDWDVVHRIVRPAASALVTVLKVAVLAGLAAAAYAAVGDGRPGRIAGAAVLGAPNGVWLGIPLGLFVPWDGSASGGLANVLPAPLDQLLGPASDTSVTVRGLAGLDSRVWLLAVAAAVMMLCAGVLTAVRTPAGRPGFAGFAGRCALALGAVTALALPLLVWLTDVSAGASVSVLGFDGFGGGLELHGPPDTAFLLGAVWGAAAGLAGALLARATGAAGRRAAPFAVAGVPGPDGRPDGTPGEDRAGAVPGPYSPSTPYRPSNPGTNPYLRMPAEPRPSWEPPRQQAPPRPGETPGAPPADPSGGIHAAPTVAGPPARSPRHAPRPRRPGGAAGEDPPPLPPPPPRRPPGGG